MHEQRASALDIDSLPAGPELDALVAERVFDWKPGAPCDGEIGEKPNSPDGWFCLRCGHRGNWGDNQEHEELPRRYSTSDAAALEVVAEIEVTQVMLWRNGLSSGWRARIAWDVEERVGEAEAPTLALAICRATLKLASR